jgi:hypothetical protein
MNFMIFLYLAEKTYKLTLVGGQNDISAPPEDGRGQGRRMFGEACKRVSVQNNGSVAGESRQDLSAHLGPNPASGAQNDYIPASVVQKLPELICPVDRTDHNGQAFGGIDGEGLARTGNGDKTCARPQRAACGQSRGARRRCPA